MTDTVAFVRLRSHTSGAWFVDPQLRPRLVADAAAKGTNLTDVAIQILCERFRVPYDPNMRRTSPNPSDEVINLSLPPKLENALARTFGSRRMDGIRKTLCDHYGLAYYGRPKQTRRRRTAAA